MIENENIKSVNPKKYIIILELLILVIMIYLFVKCLDIYSFLTEYINNQHTDEIINFGIQYINILMFMGNIVIIVFSIVMYFIMKKRHEEKYFLYSAIYYIFMFICFLIGFNILSQLQLTFYSDNLLSFVKNFSLIFNLFQIPFMIGLIFKLLGIKLRDFKGDSEINGDNEEVVKKSFRKTFREWKYYFIENKPILVIIIAIIVVGVSALIFFNSDNIFKSYGENREVDFAGTKFEVVNSYLSTVDYKGESISNDKKYIVVQVKFNSKSDVKREDFILINDNENYFSNTRAAENFADLGEAYKGDASADDTFILVYEFNNEDSLNGSKLRIYDGNDYKAIRLKLQKEDNIKVANEYNLNEEINLNESNLKNSSIKISDYEFGESFVENYRYCVNKKCYNGIQNIKPIEIYTEQKTILKVDAEVKRNKNLYVFKKFSNDSQFLHAFSKINYTINGDENTSGMINITPDELESGSSYFLVDKNVQEAEDINLFFTIRDTRYIVNLN